MFKWLIKEKIVKDEKREKELSDDLNNANQYNLRLAYNVTELQEKLQKLSETIRKIVKERNELKDMVRDQTEADLLVNALKSLGMIPTKGKSQLDSFEDNQRLQELQRRSQAMNSSVSRLGASFRGAL